MVADLPVLGFQRMAPRSVGQLPLHCSLHCVHVSYKSATVHKHAQGNLLTTFFFYSLCVVFLARFLLQFPESVVPWRYRRVPLRDATYVHVFGLVHAAELVPVQELGQDVVDAEEELLARQGRSGAGGGRGSPRSMAAARRNSTDLLHAGRGGRMIVFRHMRYIYSPSSETFVLQQSDVSTRRVEALGEAQRHTTVAGLKAKELTERLRMGLTRGQVLENRVIYGENALVLKVPTIPELLFSEIFHPFYVFQMYSVILWGFEAYWYYAGAIVLIAAVSIVQTLLETRRRMREMAELARFDCPVQVWRDGTLRSISSTQLVPGDLVHVTTGLLPCDLSLLEGGCVVNESMLTGEVRAHPHIRTLRASTVAFFRNAIAVLTSLSVFFCLFVFPMYSPFP